MRQEQTDLIDADADRKSRLKADSYQRIALAMP
jgi:hypothetical protein